MRLTMLTGLLCLAGLAGAQEVTFDFDRNADFSAYKTYTLVDSAGGRAPNELMDQNIKRAIDEQLVAKGMRRVDSGGAMQVSYQAAVDREKQFDASGAAPRFFGSGRVTTSTIEVGKLVVNFYDSSKGHLLWSGSAAKTLDINKDPEKNYRNLQKAMAKLFRYYPPGSGKK